jgi:hypothetical protein
MDADKLKSYYKINQIWFWSWIWILDDFCLSGVAFKLSVNADLKNLFWQEKMAKHYERFFCSFISFEGIMHFYYCIVFWLKLSKWNKRFNLRISNLRNVKEMKENISSWKNI